MSLKTEISSYGGWERNLRFTNDHAELVVSLEVGPRIISYKRPGQENILKNYSEEIGQAGEDAWMIRGGHRLWIAPEDEKVTYHWDNEPVDFQQTSDHEALFLSRQLEPVKLTKELRVSMGENSSEVRILHTARNDSDAPMRIATWGLTVMAEGGLEILSQPPMGSHPEDLLPNRSLVLWPYTDLTDERFQMGRQFLTLRQSDEHGPFKFGLAHRPGWAGYLWENNLFLKKFAYVEGADYPDFGCNFETFTNQNMLEIESLSPLMDVPPGGEVSHEERWFLFPLEEELELASESAVTTWINPFLEKAGISAVRP